MKIRRYFNIVTILILYTLLMFYIGWNGWVWLQTSFGWQSWGYYALLVALFSYAYVIVQVFKFIPFLRTIGSYWFAVMQYALILLPLADIAVFILQLVAVPRDTAIIWTGIVTLIMFLFIFGYGTFNAYSPVVRKYEIHIPKEAKGRKALRIAMASDMHFGKLSGVSHLKRLVHRVNEMEPDIILLPGDIIDDHPGEFIKKNMGQVMKQMQAPLGVYGVLGNHEYYGRAIPEFLQEMKKIDIHIMLDEVIKIEDSFYLVGRRDKTERDRQSFEELMSTVDKSLPVIAMDHQPFALKQAEESGVDLLLSGHTHRGQMAPNHLITRRMYELDWGYVQKGVFHAIVSSGFGFWGPPLRLGSRSEVIQIEVTFG
ncbi:metallophosphoesterase [Bacillus pseudomycoides]|uniref:metallophosphoesterase n=1 Tax=Bacillus pseudomycoides TaxID=64104 RepID=UPI000BEF6BC9|nr:metallophosphoesterase [Bacillus pseudomycoides]PEI98456.1 phosphoesterase [Bacillus pseudomycoides]PEM73892.1 phosphoesterase [Bacillus pseudomycoides]PGA58267.1 phosphoesterase [Bacillus pseudomycoides]PHA43228.1 phosphoesterase [Bacillus pseudomycoides]PHA49606.1 phosphoesterase [Bacillus pseudomycoides]